MENYYLFIGRLSEEKGIINLVNAWIEYVKGHSDEWLFICGDGPERGTVESVISQNNATAINVSVLGRQPREKALKFVAKSRAIIVPSIWYECCPMTIIESF